jgi:hypothetical protein
MIIYKHIQRGLILNFESQILEKLSSGHFVLTLHARKRMVERNINDCDIIACGVNGICISTDDGKYKIRGYDQDGDDLTVICVDSGNVLIITLF